MSKSTTSKAGANKARDTRSKTGTKAAAKKARDTRSKTGTKDAAKKAGDTRSKKARDTGRTTTKVAAETARDTHRKTSAEVAVDGDKQRKIPTHIAEFGGAQVPASMRVIGERNVDQARELYERSKNTLEAVLDSWKHSFGAAGQGAVALNRRIIEIADRKTSDGFALATGLARAKNAAEVMQLHATYWRKQFAELGGQGEEVSKQVERRRRARR
jgi:hypothetical protein